MSFFSGLAFFISVFFFLAGVPLFHYLSVELVLAIYAFWGLYINLPKHLVGGILAGLVLDSYGVLPFGSHILLFFLLGILAAFLKHVFSTHYLWGDVVIILSLSLLSEILLGFLATLFKYNMFVNFSFEFFSLRLGAFAVVALATFLVLRFLYKRESLESKPYAI